MNSITQRNGLLLEDPLEKLRGLFRTYWQYISNTELTQAHDFWEQNVSVELETIYQSRPDISRESIQSVLFEEKRRLQDHTSLVESVAEKLANYLDQKSLDIDVSSTNRSFMPSQAVNQKRESFSAKANNRVQASSTSKSLTTPESDLASMLDSMIEGEKLY